PLPGAEPLVILAVTISILSQRALRLFSPMDRPRKKSLTLSAPIELRSVDHPRLRALSRRAIASRDGSLRRHRRIQLLRAPYQCGRSGLVYRPYKHARRLTPPELSLHGLHGIYVFLRWETEGPENSPIRLGARQYPPDALS